MSYDFQISITVTDESGISRTSSVSQKQGEGGMPLNESMAFELAVIISERCGHDGYLFIADVLDSYSDFTGKKANPIEADFLMAASRVLDYWRNKKKGSQ